MTLSEEMRAYLDFLIRHEETCLMRECRTCQVARHLWSAVQSRLFEDGFSAMAHRAEAGTVASPAV